MSPSKRLDVDKLIAERRSAGLSFREIAEWLGAKGIELSHVAVKNACDRMATAKGPRRPEDAPARAAAPRANKSAPKLAGGADAEPEPGGDDAVDLATMDRMISELEADATGARANGAVQQLATFTRLLADLIERRRKLRPPPPVDADADAEAMAAGERALGKLRKLVEDAEAGRL